jgi:hypothetical protein
VESAEVPGRRGEQGGQTLKKQIIRRECGLAYDVAAIMVAVAICVCTYYIAAAFDASTSETMADAAQSGN